MAQALRSFLLDMFREAVAAGWIENNPVAVTRAPRVEVTRSRLTLDIFLAIYEQAKMFSPRVCRSMEVALVTAQRREDVRQMLFRDVREGMLWVEQEKNRRQGSHSAQPQPECCWLVGKRHHPALP